MYDIAVVEPARVRKTYIQKYFFHGSLVCESLTDCIRYWVRRTVTEVLFRRGLISLADGNVRVQYSLDFIFSSVPTSLISLFFQNLETTSERFVFNKTQFLIDMSQKQVFKHTFLRRYEFSMKMNWRVIKYNFYHLTEFLLNSSSLKILNIVLSRLLWPRTTNKSRAWNADFLNFMDMISWISWTKEVLK